MAFIRLKMFLPVSDLLRNFILSGLFIFSNTFSVSIEVIIQAFTLMLSTGGVHG